MCYWVTFANAVHNIPAETNGVRSRAVKGRHIYVP